MDFARTPRRDTTLCAKRRHWYSRDKRYRVTESRSLFGLPTIYYALVLDGACWSIISRHRTREAAQEACEQHAGQAAGAAR